MSTNSNKLVDYQTNVEILAKNKINYTFSNVSPHHASIVINTLLKFSENIVRMFDGDLSGDIANTHSESFTIIEKHVSNGKKLHIVIKDEIVSTTSKFLKKLREKYPDRVKLKIASPKFCQSIYSVFNDNIGCTIGDKSAFRLEKEDGCRKAICNFNNPGYIEELISIFDNEFENCSNYQ